MAELVNGVVAGLVAATRRADPEAHWFYDRLDRPTALRLRIALHATDAALDAVRKHDPATDFAADASAVRDAARGGSLACASSELGLTLLGGDASWLIGSELPLAVAHLRHLTGLLPAADQLAFLFLHGQDRGRHLSGALRRDLALQAKADAEKIVLTADELSPTGPVAVAWQRYLDQVARVVNHDQPVPRGFLLAQHAQLTHQRWGIEASVDALAAMALRLALFRERAMPATPSTGSSRWQRPPARTATDRGGAEPVRIDVALGDRAYPVLVGPGVRHALGAEVARIGARRAVVVSARPPEWTPDPGVPHRVVPANDGEPAKTLATVERLCREFADFGLTRADVVISCGGGTTTDVGGLAAALYHRGIAVIHLPTSLLAQVDASVGGKTAVNLPEGKNLVGAYWQPRAVLCDTDHLTTLPDREWRNGSGEVARAHFIGAGDLRGRPVAEQVTACVALKAWVVAADEQDAGLRHILNYGHTLGHALERATQYRLRHGEAVGVGTVFAGRLAGLLNRISVDRVVEHHEVVASYGLDTTLPDGVDQEELLALMRRDKKATTGLSFVLDGPVGVELVTDVPEPTVRAALAQM